VQSDLSRWDYKHQVLQSTHVPNWRVLLWVKLIETVCQLRPKSLLRLFGHPDPLFRAGMRWYSNIGRRVWCYEIWQWLFYDRRVCHGPTVGEFLKDGWRGEHTSLPSTKPVLSARPEAAPFWPPSASPGSGVRFQLGRGLIGMAMLLIAVMLPIVRRQKAPAEHEGWPEATPAVTAATPAPQGMPGNPL